MADFAAEAQVAPTLIIDHSSSSSRSNPSPTEEMERALVATGDPATVLAWLQAPEHTFTTALLPRYVPPRAQPDPSAMITKIPRIFVQTAASTTINKTYAIHTWQTLLANPTYAYRFFDNDDCLAYIEQHYGVGSLVARAYKALVPGAFKADLFRYCFMYQDGGVYLDVNKKLVVPLDELITGQFTSPTPLIHPLLRTRSTTANKNTDNWPLLLEQQQQSSSLAPTAVGHYSRPRSALDLVLVLDMQPGNIYQALLLAKPGLLLFKHCIDRVVRHARKHYYGPSGLHVTGPALIGQLILQAMYGFYHRHPHTTVIVGDGERMICELLVYNGSRIYDQDGRTIAEVTAARRVITGSKSIMSNGQIPYGEMYSKRQVYDLSIFPKESNHIAKIGEVLLVIAGVAGAVLLFVALLWPRKPHLFQKDT